MDDITTTQKVFSKIGWVYTIFSVAVTVLQLLLINVVHFLNPELLTMEVQILLSTSILYICGMLILTLGLKKYKVPVIVIEKKKMTTGAFFKALLMSYSLLIITNLIGTLITTWIGMLKGSPVINPIEEIALNMDIPFLILFTVIGAPIFEELFFRKFLVDRTAQYGECVSVIISGLMFGLFHGNLSQFPYAFALGAFFAYIYIRTGKIGYTITMHAIINFMGSIVGSLILQNIDLSVYDKILNSTSIEEILAAFTMENMFGVFVLLIYEMVIMTFVVIGIIFWILDFKKFIFKPAENDIPKGRCFETSICNTGMLVYIVFWGIMIIIASIKV